MLRLTSLAVPFWWVVRLGDTPARGIVFMRPLYSILEKMLSVYNFMSDKLEMYLDSFNKAKEVVEEVKRRGSNLGFHE